MGCAVLRGERRPAPPAEGGRYLRLVVAGTTGSGTGSGTGRGTGRGKGGSAGGGAGLCSAVVATWRDGRGSRGPGETGGSGRAGAEPPATVPVQVPARRPNPLETCRELWRFSGTASGTSPGGSSLGRAVPRLEAPAPPLHFFLSFHFFLDKYEATLNRNN